MNAINRPMPKIYFYIPSQELIDKVPATIQGYWGWIHGAIKSMPVQLPSGESCTWMGPYSWTIQAYIYLRNQGFPCALTAFIPDEGIVISHSKFLPVFLKPSNRQFIVELKPDKFLECIYANFVIVQNGRDPVHNGAKRILIRSAFVNNWPQPGLVSRDPNRGDRFENICFMGNAVEFLEEANVLGSEIRGLGLNWAMTPREYWHDYSEVDAVVAVRSNDSLMFDRKPSARLTNAWLAGVPAIVSPDIAFEDIKKSELDYIPARNIPEIIAGLKCLMKDIKLRRAMVENGRKRSGEFNAERNVQKWVEIIEQQIIPEYVRWAKSPLRRNLFYLMRISAHKMNKLDPDIREKNTSKLVR